MNTDQQMLAFLETKVQKFLTKGRAVDAQQCFTQLTVLYR